MSFVGKAISGLFGGGGSHTPAPPPPPPPPANPPAYASAAPTLPNTNNALAGLGASILTSSIGTPDQRSTQRKSLFGQ